MRDAPPSQGDRMKRIGVALVLGMVGIAVAGVAVAQAPVQKPKFEVASIRVTKECKGRSPTGSPGRLSVPCYSVANLIERAYGRFAGGRSNPEWSVPKVEG